MIQLQLSRRGLMLGLAGSAAISTSWIGSASAQPAVVEKLATERLKRALLAPELGRVIYRGKPAYDVNEAGAAGQNRDRFSYIEMQGIGYDIVCRGLFAADNTMIDQGWKVLDWGLKQQQPDGGFGPKDDFHSATIYLAQLGTSCLIDPRNATNSRLDGLSRGIAWISDPRNSVRGMVRNLGFCHRFWLVAAMYDAASSVLDRPDLSRRGAAFALDGARLQMADGTNPEKNGFDAGYQMVGVVFGARYVLTTSDPIGHQAALGMLPKAMDREAKEIGPSGEISTAGSTRMGREVGFSGSLKKLSRSAVAEGFFLGWQATKDSKYHDLFRRVSHL